MKKLLSSLMIVVLIFTMTGCVSSKPQDTVKSYLDNLKSGEIEKSAMCLIQDSDSSTTPDEIISDDDEDEKFNEAFKTAYSKLEYEILESKTDGDNAVVKTEINTPNLGNIMTEIIKESIPVILSSAFDDTNDEELDEKMENHMSEMLIDKMNSDDIPMVKKKIDINLVKKEGKWLIDPNEEFFNAITGNLTSFTDLLDELGE